MSLSSDSSTTGAFAGALFFSSTGAATDSTTAGCACTAADGVAEQPEMRSLITFEHSSENLNFLRSEIKTNIKSFLKGPAKELSGFSSQIVNMKDSESKAPLHIAIEKENFSVAKLLISNGADCTKTSYQDNFPIHLAAKGNSVEIINLLVSAKAHVNCVNARGETPLHVSAAFDKPENIELLIKYRVVKILAKHDNSLIHGEDENSNTPLHLAALNGHKEVVKFLIENNADFEARLLICINTRNQFLWTPLDCAATNGNVKVCRILLNDDASIDAKDRTTPLHLASASGHCDVVSLLIDEGADVTLRDSNGFNSLDRAIYNNHPSLSNSHVLEKLLKQF
ncbi:ankyrin repeat, PH and SEC7 domain containing protein secG-like [Octopus sinensis]|uniref:Ankyrin repeat, PH and SEC7 domain containing protein secG-like n=1 Tax=Octopus sinensis TaxID=2607531 RepID=A0A7E6EGZ4_9MOLL|nr:ankyrin repeat, PH and SEC7 domain containing protein secG-like [Octopus sinensis]